MAASMATGQNPSSARKVMWMLMMIPFFADFYVRQALPQLISIITLELGSTPAEKAMLLGSFFPGYVVGQIPSGILSKLYGAKPIITANLFGNAALLLLLPLAARRSVLSICACLTGIGLFQSPMVPAVSVLYRQWMPPGPERAFALAIPELGSKISMVLSPLTVPWLAARNAGGWTAVVVPYGIGMAAFGALWHVCATDTAAEWHRPASERPIVVGFARLRAMLLPSMNGAERQMLMSSSAANDGNEPASTHGKLREVLRSQALLARTPAAYAPVLAHVCDCLTVYAMMQWVPTIYAEKFSCTPSETGRYIAIPNLMHWAAQFFSAALERLAAKHGELTPLQIRRTCVFGGATLKSTALLCFAVATTPLQATIFFTLNNLVSSVHLSGFVQNYLEVGGEDVAVLMSTGNTVSNLTGILIPLVATMFRRRFGVAGWVTPFFGAVAVFHMVCAGLFCMLAKVESARSLRTAMTMQEKLSSIKQEVAAAAEKKRRRKEDAAIRKGR